MIDISMEAWEKEMVEASINFLLKDMLESLVDEAQKLRDGHFKHMEEYMHGTDTHTIGEVKPLPQRTKAPYASLEGKLQEVDSIMKSKAKGANGKGK